MALSLDIAANTRQAQSQVKDLGKELDKVGDVLDDVAKEGDKAGDKLESSFREMGRDADKAGKDIKKGVGDGLKDGAREAKSSGKEAAASFTGEFEDVGDFIQETAANAFEGFGPLGAAAGIAAAAGIGILTAEVQKQNELAEALREKLSAAWQEAAEEGREYLSTAQIIAEANSLMFDKDRAEEYKTVLDDQARIGADLYTIVAAYTGDLSAQEDIQSRINDLIDSEAGTYETIRDGISKVNPEVQGMADRWGVVIEESEKASQATKDYKDFVTQANETARAQTQRTRDADQGRWEAFAAAAEAAKRRAAGDVTVTIKADDSSARRTLASFQRLAGQGVRVPVGLGRTWE